MNTVSGNRSYWRKIVGLRSEALWVLIGQLGIAVGALVGVKILTQVLDPLEFGRLALANTLVLLVGTNLFGPLGQGVMRFWSISQERNQVREFVFATNRYARILMLTVLGASLVSLLLLAVRAFADWPALIAVSLIAGALTGYLGLRLSVFLAARKRKIVAIANTGTSFLKPLIAVLFVLSMFSTANCVMWGYVAATLIMVCMVEYEYRKTVDHALRSSPSTGSSVTGASPLGKEIISFSWPFCIWGIFGWIHQSCDRWSLQAFHGADVVGAFSIISILASYPLIFGANLLGNLFIPIAYQRAGDGKSRSVIQSAYRVLFLMTGLFVLWACFVIMLFTFFHSNIVLLLSNSKYVAFSDLLPGLTAAWGFFYLGQVLSSFGLLAKRPATYILPIIVSALLAATTTFSLSRVRGAEGVVWGLGISGFVYAVWFMGIGLSLVRRSKQSAIRLMENDGMCVGDF